MDVDVSEYVTPHDALVALKGAGYPVPYIKSTAKTYALAEAFRIIKYDAQTCSIEPVRAVYAVNGPAGVIALGWGAEDEQGFPGARPFTEHIADANLEQPVSDDDNIVFMFHRGDLKRLWPNLPDSFVSGMIAEPPYRITRAGRRPTYDWAEILRAAVDVVEALKRTGRRPTNDQMLDALEGRLERDGRAAPDRDWMLKKLRPVFQLLTG